MKVTAYVAHSDCARHDPGWRSPEHQGRLPAVARAVYRDMLTLFDPLLEVEGVPAGPEDLRLVHTAEYVARVRRAVEAAAAAGEPLPFEEGVVVSDASWDAAVAGAGCALTAADLVLEGSVRNAFCAVRPPGGEVGADHAGGYGLFNNVAIAARHLRERRGVERILVVAVGASPGRGTAEILAADPGLRFLSVHRALPPGAPPLPPAARSVALPAGATGADLLGVLPPALAEATAGFHPDFLLLSLGFDALAADPLGGLSLEPADYHALSRELRERADALCAGRLVSVMEGGYDPPATARAVVQHLRALAGVEPA